MSNILIIPDTADSKDFVIKCKNNKLTVIIEGEKLTKVLDLGLAVKNNGVPLLWYTVKTTKKKKKGTSK